MKIIVLNGSPKGKISSTMQYVHFIEKKFPGHEMEIINIAQKINKYEKNVDAFNELIDEIAGADGVLWATPVYYLLVPSNYKRFIELVFERGAQAAFKDKLTAVFTTSIHYFDHLAHNYLHSICDDLEMAFFGSFSSDMYDMLKPGERDRLELFATGFFDSISRPIPCPRSFPKIKRAGGEYAPETEIKTIDMAGKRVLVLTDDDGNSPNITAMTQRFVDSISEAEVINLHDLKIAGSCLGCIKCGFDNHCVYEGKDDYIDFYKNKVMQADIILWAGTITDRYLSSMWKMYFDRSFFMGHTPTLEGKQIGVLISGPLAQVSNLKEIIEAYTEMQHANLCGIVTDEPDSSAEIDLMIQNMGERMAVFSRSGYIGAETFRSFGGRKVFRDDIWSRLRFPFRADHEYFKKTNTYDFPQRKHRARIQNSIMNFLSKSGKFRKEVNKRMIHEMIKPLQGVLSKLD